MTLLSDIQTLLHIWFPNKEDDKENYNQWFDTIYTNGIFETDID